jgi:hypothetical protein
MLDESNRQQAALQASHTAVSHMVTDCADLLMAIIARLAYVLCLLTGPSYSYCG